MTNEKVIMRALKEMTHEMEMLRDELIKSRKLNEDLIKREDRLIKQINRDAEFDLCVKNNTHQVATGRMSLSDYALTMCKLYDSHANGKI